MRKRDPNRIEMGRRFREARERLNWSREVLAERADLSVSFIADLELGNTGTRLENFIRLCRLLDLNADYVLFGAPGDAVQRIMDLLRNRDEETVRVVERTVEALLRADPTTRANFYEKMIQNSVFNPDECRAKEEKNPIPGGWGKRFLVTKNLGSLESVLKGEESNA